MGHRAAGLSFLPRFPVRFFIFQLPQLLFQPAVLHIMAGLDFQGPQAGQEKPCQEAAQDDQGQAHRKMPEKETDFHRHGILEGEDRYQKSNDSHEDYIQHMSTSFLSGSRVYQFDNSVMYYYIAFRKEKEGAVACAMM